MFIIHLSSLDCHVITSNNITKLLSMLDTPIFCEDYDDDDQSCRRFVFKKPTINMPILQTSRHHISFSLVPYYNYSDDCPFSDSKLLCC